MIGGMPPSGQAPAVTENSHQETTHIISAVAYYYNLSFLTILDCAGQIISATYLQAKAYIIGLFIVQLGLYVQLFRSLNEIIHEVKDTNIVR